VPTEQDLAAARTLAPDERNRILGNQLMARAVLARTDPAEFISFVMRDEEGRRIKTADVHRLMVMFALYAKDMNGLGGRAAIIAPVESGKSFSISVGLTSWMIGRNPNLTGGIVSATEMQASKVLEKIRNFIESSQELKLVFPHLQKSIQAGWTRTSFTVERTGGAKDPTLEAFGHDTKRLAGSRLAWVVGDDLLTLENCNTKEQRDKLQNFLLMMLKTRMLPNARVVLVNSAMHPDDFFHRAIRLGWPVMRLDHYGAIEFHNTTFAMEDGDPGADLVVPAEPGTSSVCVLKSMQEEPDPNLKVLFPERFSIARLEGLRKEYQGGIVAFMSAYCSICRDDETALCPSSCIEITKENGRALEMLEPVHATVLAEGGGNKQPWLHDVLTFTGVDLAFEQTSKNDYTAIATIALLRAKVGTSTVHKALLWLDVGRWPVAETWRKILQHHKRYDSIVVVENNGAQRILRQLMLTMDASLPIKPFETGANKNRPDHGLPGLFAEMSQGAWAFPCAADGTTVKVIDDLISGCLTYTPDRHPNDAMMALWIANEYARKHMGAIDASKRSIGGSLGMNIMSR
jgi:hypothetical protein